MVSCEIFHCGAWTYMERAGSIAAVFRLSCSAGNVGSEFPDQGLKPTPLRCKANS